MLGSPKWEEHVAWLPGYSMYHVSSSESGHDTALESLWEPEWAQLVHSNEFPAMTQQPPWRTRRSGVLMGLAAEAEWRQRRCDTELASRGCEPDFGVMLSYWMCNEIFKLQTPKRIMEAKPLSMGLSEGWQHVLLQHGKPVLTIYEGCQYKTAAPDKKSEWEWAQWINDERTEASLLVSSM